MRADLSLLLLPLLAHACSCARILGINPTPSISHQRPFLVIIRALAERGHHVTIITPNPMEGPPPNTTQIDISFMYDEWKNAVDFTKIGQLSKDERLEMMINAAHKGCDLQLQTPAVKQLHYQENMKRFSAIYREHQSTSLDSAVWWVEYVIRHQGAPHLRSAALDLHWWQLLLLDVIAFILAVAAVAAFLLYKLTRWFFSWLTRPSKLKKQ
ncbi:UDP-glucosyltransferase 2-like isoform X3 [Schistocerca serialis cubense]|nr:UDP-glucosyltransferase 2-like isoform X3 [Schistocerca serialis cubense]